MLNFITKYGNIYVVQKRDKKEAVPMIKERNIAVCIILSILTCGIYGIYWFCKMTSEVAETNNSEYHTSGGTAFLFTLLTCGLYSIYWSYKMGKALDDIKVSRGMPASDRSVIYLLLSIFGLSIVAWVLIQSELNSLADA